MAGRFVVPTSVLTTGSDDSLNHILLAIQESGAEAFVPMAVEITLGGTDPVGVPIEFRLTTNVGSGAPPFTGMTEITSTQLVYATGLNAAQTFSLNVFEDADQSSAEPGIVLRKWFIHPYNGKLLYRFPEPSVFDNRQVGTPVRRGLIVMCMTPASDVNVLVNVEFQYQH